jgi:hypothetical protein
MLLDFTYSFNVDPPDAYTHSMWIRRTLTLKLSKLQDMLQEWQVDLVTANLCCGKIDGVHRGAVRQTFG